MKKFMFMLLAASTLASCSKKSEANESGKDSAKVEAATTEAKAEVSFASPDLALYNLNGLVKSVSGSYCNSDKDGKETEGQFMEYSIAFDKDGVLQTDDVRNYNIKTSQSERDAEGRLTKIHHEPDEDFGADTSYEFGYKEGRLVSSLNEWMGEISGGSSATYTYDEEGNVVKVVTKGDSDGISFTYTYTYTIKEKDAKGNWTKRLVYYEEEESSGDAGEKLSVSQYYRMETRKIQYFE